MPRRPRILLAEQPLHIVQRGINREPCFFAEEDFLFYLHWLEESARACGCAIHAYTLMTNHAHLLLTPAEAGRAGAADAVDWPPLRPVRQSLLLPQRQPVGRPLQVERGAGGELSLACMRYIELNPVRAGMVGDPGQYRWSSYRANGLGQADARLTPHSLYLALAAHADERRVAYRALFRPHLDEEAASDIR
jgi:putative transposase